MFSCSPTSSSSCIWTITNKQCFLVVVIELTTVRELPPIVVSGKLSCVKQIKQGSQHFLICTAKVNRPRGERHRKFTPSFIKWLSYFKETAKYCGFPAALEGRAKTLINDKYLSR